MTLLWPLWLLLLIPLAAALWVWPPPTRVLRLLRLVVLALLVTALASPVIELPRRAGTIVVVADRSQSMPEGFDASQREVLSLLDQSRSERGRLLLVSFAERAALEPSASDFAQSYQGTASRLSQAVERGLALIPGDGSGRLLVLSDGRWTGDDPTPLGHLAASRGVPIDYRLLRRPVENDLALVNVDAPDEVSPGEAYAIIAWVQSPSDQRADIELRGGGQVIARGSRQLQAGLNRLVFRDRSQGAGTVAYRLRIEGESSDPVQQNNLGRFLVSSSGKRPLLLVSESSSQGLAQLLRRGGLQVEVRSPRRIHWGLETLSGYSGVIVENVPADRLGRSAMQDLSAWVREAAGGLLMTGGRRSYGPGGYFQSPLDPILPVSMELRQEHRKFALSIVLALDRSGSMAVPVDGAGLTKMQLANRASLEVLDMLSDQDEFGLVGVDSAPHIVVPLGAVSEVKADRSLVASLAPAGGGIFVYEALKAAAAQALEAKNATRHVILFADAADAEQPGQYIRLLEEMRRAGITVSVVGLGTDADTDAPLLEDVATRGGGQLYFTEDAQELPRLFAQDTFLVARSTFIEKPTPVRFTAGLYSLMGQVLPQPPSIDGYNLAYLRPQAEQAALSGDEYEAPLVASWQAGAGRVLAYTGEADGEYTGPLAGWESVGEMWSGLARWTAGEEQSLPDHMLLRRTLREGLLKVELQLDPERRQGDPSRLPRLHLLRQLPGQPPQSEETTLRWTSPDVLEATLPARGSETLLPVVEMEGEGRIALPAVQMLYSPEYAPQDQERGASTLRRLAQASGGVQRLDLASTWGDLPRLPRRIPLRPWLLALALAILLAEVLERRSGWISARLGSLALPKEADSTPPRSTQEKVPIAADQSRQKAAPQAPPRAAAQEESREPASELGEALRQARRRAGRRTRKG
ncbi:MAG TPA: vWA domain-containing protein [Acidobacteriota bacterium]|nr:vWA domain-containing protein [Acidobacteriota bacterium]